MFMKKKESLFTFNIITSIHFTSECNGYLKFPYPPPLDGNFNFSFVTKQEMRIFITREFAGMQPAQYPRHDLSKLHLL